MASLPLRLASLFEASQKAFAKRLATGKQPLPPAFVRHTAGGALRFLDYTDTSALVAVNGAYLVVVALLYAWMRSRQAGFTLRGAMVVRTSPACAQKRCSHPRWGCSRPVRLDLVAPPADTPRRRPRHRSTTPSAWPWPPMWCTAWPPTSGSTQARSRATAWTAVPTGVACHTSSGACGQTLAGRTPTSPPMWLTRPSPPPRCVQGVLRAEVPGVWGHPVLCAPPLLPPADGAAPVPPRVHHPGGAHARGPRVRLHRVHAPHCPTLHRRPPSSATT
jgi:hypothetical protein